MEDSPFLDIKSGDSVKQYQLCRKQMTIGRSSDNDIVLDDMDVSRHHAGLLWDDDVLRITDHTSSNGTIVNGEKIKPDMPYTMKDGDVIHIGSNLLIVHLPSPAPDTQTKTGIKEQAAPERIPDKPPAGKVKSSRVKLAAIIVGSLVVVACIVLAFVLIEPGHGEDVRLQFADALIKKNAAVMQSMDEEITAIEKDLEMAIEKQVKLKEVADPALEWVALQEREQRENPRINTTNLKVTDDGLVTLKNVVFQVTKLELLAERVGTSQEKFSATIEIKELASGTKRGWEAIDRELDEQVVGLQQKRRNKVEEREITEQALLDVIAHWDTWASQDNGDGSYTLSGSGLGTAESLTSGQWIYYYDSGEATPVDAPAKKLGEILTTVP
jgi:predicted component of type VI protein secretion system